MGSHIVDIFRQGIWASLTGGWFYDPHQNIFSNTFHLYLWMGLLVLPFILHLTLEPTLAVWIIYCAVVGVVFGLIKIVNYKLHHLFDTSEVIEEPVEKGDKSTDEKGSKIIEIGSNENEVEQIEMVPIPSQTTQAVGNEENNNRQITIGRGLQRKGALHLKDRRPDISGPAPLAECEVDEIDQSQETTDKSNDTKNGSTPSLKGAEGGVDDSVNQTSKSNQITTTAEVAINHQVSDGEMEPGEIKTTMPLKEDTDSDLSPEGGPKIRKRRKAVRRTKSALETTCEVYPRRIKHSSEDLHSSLPTRLFTQEESENEFDPAKSGIFRPVRKRSKKEKKEEKEVSDDMTIVDLEGLNDGRTSPFKQRAPTPHCRKKQLISPDTEKHEKRPGRYGRSVSVDERMIPFRPRLVTPDSHSMRKVKKSDLDKKVQERMAKEQSGRKDLSDHPDILADLPLSADITPKTSKSASESTNINLGEVKLDIKKRTGVKSKPRPSSAGDIKSLHSSCDPKSAINGNGGRNGRSKDSHVSSRIVKFLQNGSIGDRQDVPSEQSSTVGLDWLFSTDSDSSDEGDSHPRVSYLSESSSTATFEGDSTFDTTPKEAFLPHDEEKEEGEITVVDENLEKMKKQGAIPKHYSRGQQPCLSSPTTEEIEAVSPSSSEAIDPEDFRKKILEILSSPWDNNEQMKTLFKAIMDAKGRPRRPSSSREPPSPGERRRQNSKASEEMGEASAVKEEEGEGRSSKSTTPTENSTLLPSQNILGAGTSGVRQRKVGRGRQRGKGKSRAKNSKEKHIATSHDDTTDGAVHWFQDEKGNWSSYTFGDEWGTTITSENAAHQRTESFLSTPSSSDSGSTVNLNESIVHKTPDEDNHLRFLPRHTIDIPGIINPQEFQEILGRQRRTTCDSSSDSDNFQSIKEEKPKHFYKFHILCKKFIKIRFDRLALLALLDRNLTVLENLTAVIIAILVGALGALVLSSNFYHDIWVFLFCFIIASCQYSLVKSVQPDAASPMHGYNRMVVFSRPFYFCLCCGLMLLLDYCQSQVSTSSFVYGTSTSVVSSLQFGRDLLKVFVLCFPILFTIGLLPQVNTFIMYLLEQIDMHVFGGNASVSLTSSVYCFTRSVLAIAVLYAFCFIAIQDSDKACEDKDLAQHPVFSMFSAILVAVSYHLSRSASDPNTLWMLVKDYLCPSEEESQEEGELVDPLPAKLKKCVSQRLQSDLLVSPVIMIIVFSVHISTVFSSPVLQPVLSDILYYIAASVGFLIHYVVPMLRKEMPWLCCSHPILANRERNFFEVIVTPKIMLFEKFYVWLCFFERNMMYPVVFLCALTRSTPHIICSLGKFIGPLVLVICAMKLLRFAFSNTAKQYLVISFTVFFFNYDYRRAPDTFLVYFFIVSILMCKFCDLMLKMKFIITYIAPWQITWGSAFHAFAQPFSVPHSAMLFVQAGVSALFSTPLNPFLGSAIFFTSYVRPIKFWEKDYNTKRVDHSNTRLSSQLERNPGADDNNLNSIFYEHLTRSLQHSLCGDLMLGRWGNAEQGDCFIMASDYLNALVHVIEMGNGLVTFQLRGLEFRGTYCQQREVEAITEGVEDNEGFCCCEPGHLPHFLSLNAAFNQRWLAWEVVVTKYVLEGYSISDNSAATMVHGFDTRKILLNYYVMSIIYYTVRSPHLEGWIQVESIVEHLQSTLAENFVDVDPVFTISTDEDYDVKLKGVSRNTFCTSYLDWIQYCANRRQLAVESEKESALVSLCYCLSLLGRRALGTASHNNAATCGDFFLYGLHALFKGDFRITSPHDEWVFADMELLRRVVAPGIRMALKLHQDSYLFTDEYDDHEALYDAISNYEQNMVISHEADPQWRNAVLSNTPSLLALRHVFDVEGSDEYKIIMLNKKYLTFRVVKVNRECVRGLWAGQQQELIYLRNRNPERGSIQNAKQALRNMINSSCDQPIGYPIYVSPLTTSYSSTHADLSSIIGGEFNFANVKSFFKNLWVNMRRHCGATCAGSSSGFEESVPYSISCSHPGAATALGHTNRSTLSTPTNQQDIALQSLGNRGSLVSTASTASKPLTLVSLAGFISETTSTKETLSHKVRIMDPSLIFDNINLGRRIDVQWPNEEWRQNGGKNGWHGWIPVKGMEGTVVHKWVPCHRETVKRSHVDKVILLVQIGEKYVPVAEQGVLDLGAEV